MRKVRDNKAGGLQSRVFRKGREKLQSRVLWSDSLNVAGLSHHPSPKTKTGREPGSCWKPDLGRRFAKVLLVGENLSPRSDLRCPRY